jgi:transcriptional regulator with XRE-family HTH domain
MGIKIRIAREARGLTQQQLAKRVNRERSQVSRAEKSGSKDIEFIRELEEALEVQRGWLA